MPQQILSTDSDTLACQKRRYQFLIANNWPEQDEMAHIEDTPLFWANVNGRPTRLSWNQMTDEQRDMQRQAEQRAFEIAAFDLCNWEG